MMLKEPKVSEILTRIDDRFPVQRVAIEGGDASGKSTLIKKLIAILPDDINLTTVAEPAAVNDQATLRGKLRQIIMTEDLDDYTAATLFAIARADLNHQITLPAMDNGNMILSDRSIISSLIYQTLNGNLSEDEILGINRRFDPQFAMPDKLIYVDIEPRYAEARLQQNQPVVNAAEREDNHFDRIDLHRKEWMRERFLKYTMHYPQHLILRAKDIEDQPEVALAQLIEFLAKPIMH